MHVSQKKKRKPSWWRYIVEFNRIIRDNIRVGARLLERKGIDVEIAPHKTTLILKRPRSMSWLEFKSAIRSTIHPRIGEAVIFSETTGNSYTCSNRGNHSGRFVRL